MIHVRRVRFWYWLDPTGASETDGELYVLAGKLHSPGEQEYGRNAESHQNAHNHEDWQVTGDTSDYDRSRDEELTET